MSPEQQRITIAEACGWIPSTYGGRWCHPNDLSMARNGSYEVWKGRDKLPDYLYDLNAMHEAEKMLNTPIHMQKHAWNNYKGILEDVSKGSSFHATAAQRAEAFLRTIDKWID
jgi:hypothetical protein